MLIPSTQPGLLSPSPQQPSPTMMQHLNPFRRARRVDNIPPLSGPTPPPAPPKPPLAPLLQSTYRPQPNCPLFTRIPPELRTRIYEYALAEYDDLDHPYREDTFYYRPGYHYHRRIDTSLLLTCRLVYLESHLIPLSVNEHVFYYYRGHPTLRQLDAIALSPTNYAYPYHPDSYRPKTESYFLSLTPSQRDAATHLHLFMQQYLLEDVWQRVSRIPEMRPKKLTLTIRHTDWWFWENGEALGIDPRLPGRVKAHEMLPATPDDDRIAAASPATRSETAWGRQFKNIPTLQDLVIELETVESKKAELDGIVRRAKGWRFGLADGRVLVREEADTRTYSWIGPLKFNGRVAGPPPPVPPPPQYWVHMGGGGVGAAPVPNFLTLQHHPAPGVAGADAGAGADDATTDTTPATAAAEGSQAVVATAPPAPDPVRAGLPMYVVVMRWRARTVPGESDSAGS
ncbi:hypothetical protein FGG08_004401 [Glutinoglossum americanum]|uniref:Uncharacterized protein n=1 Tax=Glutinoglossum americanum TaxID=1670608 RepID=A0A9P8KX54_9PEZI|nr:hypothetical protein FGG08_004401 [Glutinoglossum americanum]